MLLLTLLLAGHLNTDLLVNDDTFGGCEQYAPAIAQDDSGCFYLVWTDYRKSDYDCNVYVQKFDASGRRVGSNRDVTPPMRSRDVWCYRTSVGDVLVKGSRVLVATQDCRSGTPDIYVQEFDRQLDPSSSMLLVNDDGRMVDRRAPHLAVAGSSFIVVWLDGREGLASVYGQILDSNLQPIAPNFRISEMVGAVQNWPGATGCENGFVVTWMQTEGGQDYVYARWFSPTGVPITGSLKVFPTATAASFCASDSAGYCWIGAEEERAPQRNVLISLFDQQGRQVTGPLVANDSYPSPYPRYPAGGVARDHRRMLVVWVDSRGRIQEYGQLVDSLGGRIGGNFPISGVSSGANMTCCIYRDSDCYMVGWVDSRENNSDIFCFHPTAGESRVNDDTASSIQDFPCVVMDSIGNSFLTWYDRRNGVNDADIFAAYYDTSGHPLGANFRINDDGPGNEQLFPSLSANRRGDVVVAWHDARRGKTDVYGQRFDSRGTRIGTNFRCSDTPGAPDWPAYVPHIALNDSGDFLIAWLSESTVCCQLCGRDGERIGNNHWVGPSDFWAVPSLLNDRSFWLAWVRRDSIYLQRFYPPGEPQPQTAPQLVAYVPFTGALDLAMAGDGRIWVVWTDRRTEASEVHGRIFAPNGSPVAPDFLINDDGVGCEHVFPRIASDGERLYITFTDFRVVGGPNVMAQAFTNSGARLGRNWCINQDPYSDVHHWAWQSAAGCHHYSALVWEDNRNSRSWDIYFRLEPPAPWERTEQGPFLTPSRYLDFRPIMRSNSEIRLPVTGCQPTEFELLDCTGRVIRKEHSDGTQEAVVISLAGLRTGTYFLLTRTRGADDIKRLIILE